MRINMVCLGNICRSPMAAAVLAGKAQDRGRQITALSSGTAAYHVGEDAHPMAKQVWQAAGYRHLHTARQFQRDMFATDDLILVMDQQNLSNVLRLAKNAQEREKVHLLRSFDSVAEPGAEVPDPWGRPIAEFEVVLAMIERAVDGLLDQLPT